MNIKKALSLFLTVIMLLSVIPIAFATEPVALSSDNVEEWPVVEGKIYFGQTIGEVLTLTGGVVKHNDTVVEGSFEFIDNELRPTYSTSKSADIKFVPADTAAYSGFEITSCANVKYSVNKTTPVFVDENDTVPIATEVEDGAKLSTSTLSGAVTKNPYYAEESKILAGKWRWVTSSVNVTASGYFQARLVVSGYEYLYAWVPVRIAGDTSPLKLPTIISENPTIEPVTIGSKHSTLVLSGGKATDIDGNELKGSFAVESPDNLVSTMTASAKIVFTPEDTAYSTAVVSILLKVNPTKMKFIDSDGNEIVPEIEIPYSSSKYYNVLSTIKSKLAPYAICGASTFNVDYRNSNGVTLPGFNDSIQIGTKEMQVYAKSTNTSFEPAILSIKVKVVPAEFLVSRVNYSNNRILVTFYNTTKLDGVFEYYYEGNLIGTSLKNSGSTTTSLAWTPETSGIFDILIKYIPAENDKYFVNDIQVDDISVNLNRNVTVESALIKLNNRYETTYDFSYNSDVTVIAETHKAFDHWEITDKSGNEVVLENVTLNTTSLKFKMPDFDIFIKAVEIQPHKVIVKDAMIKTPLGSGNEYSFYEGESVQIDFYSETITSELFNGFVILDGEGNEYIPEGMTAEDLLNTTITFNMPDFDITVTAKSTVTDCKCICHHTNPITSFLWKIIAFFIHLFGINSVCACGITH
ncbi:MAG: hypothetical protein E7573_00120 [Ruminococcaceae bacterium]|nr:hypothetical protein [Oscillospiraceae bacterium]MBR3595755.1 hypothetical protein [Clostridia bacterium]